MKYMNICKTTLILAEFVYPILEFWSQTKGITNGEKDDAKDIPTYSV